MFSWTRKVSYKGLSDSRRVWQGHDMFYQERWNLWKQRFIKLSLPSSELSEEIGMLAKTGVTKMNDVEARASTSRSESTCWTASVRRPSTEYDVQRLAGTQVLDKGKQRVLQTPTQITHFGSLPVSFKTSQSAASAPEMEAIDMGKIESTTVETRPAELKLVETRPVETNMTDPIPAEMKP